MAQKMFVQGSSYIRSLPVGTGVHTCVHKAMGSVRSHRPHPGLPGKLQVFQEFQNLITGLAVCYEGMFIKGGRTYFIIIF